jgi:hypothetical protein
LVRVAWEDFVRLANPTITKLVHQTAKAA